MSDHDAASVVGQAAGLTEQKDPMAPEQLIERFCGSIQGDGEMSTARGFCGFDGSGGYDDGYDFMGDLVDRGWRPLPAKGDWPYLIYLSWHDGAYEGWALAEYCEGDLTVWQFETVAAAKAHYAELRDCP